MLSVLIFREGLIIKANFINCLGMSLNFSDWKLNDTFAFFKGYIVPIKKVDVETCLKCSTQNLCPAVEPINLPPVDPVEDVEESIQSKSCHVVRGYVLDNAYFVQHDNLRNKGDTFKPETVAPGKFPRSPTRLNNASKHKSSWQEYFKVRKVVTKRVIGLHYKEVSQLTGLSLLLTVQ